MHRPTVSSVTGLERARSRSPRAHGNLSPTVRLGLDHACPIDALPLGGVRRPRRVRSIVFDTAGDHLRKTNIILRGCEIHGASFFELSWTRPLPCCVDRGSVASRTPTLDFGANLLDLSPDLRRATGDKPLKARCVTDTERREGIIEEPDARIAVALDDGFVELDGERSAVHEIELRLLEGDAAQLWRSAADLASLLPARYLPSTARELALAKATGRDTTTVKARPIALDRKVSLDEAVGLILVSCLDHFVANWPALAPAYDPEEAVHQMRVALRRLRAGIGLFRRSLRSEGLERASARAKELAAALGKARDLDILADMLSSGTVPGTAGEPSFYALIDAVECRRRRAHEAVRALIAARETTRFVLDLRATLAAREWSISAAMQAEDAALDPRAAGSARAFAIVSLARLHRKATKKGRALASLTPQERHRTRIAVKKARYAAEFFSSLFDARSARDYLRRAQAIQDALGASNDLSTAERLLSEIEDERQSFFSAKTIVAACRKHTQSKTYDLQKVRKWIKKLTPFWQ